MSWVSRAKHLYRRIRHAEGSEADLHEEIESYFEVMIARRMSEGMTREEAQRSARLAFSGPGHVKERVREARTGAGLETTLQDLRYAFRVLRKNPGFAAVAVMSLGLGLGANTAIFTLVNAVMLKTLPIREPDQVVFVDNSGGKSGGTSGPPYPCYERLRDNNHYFSGMAAFSQDLQRVTIDGVQERLFMQYASGSYFQVLGVGAALGRVLTPADDSVVGRGGPDGGVAVIGYGLWDRRFGRSPAVLGKTIQVGTNWVTIVGVAPPGFGGLEAGLPVDVTIPMMLTGNNLRSKASWWFSVVGRLKDGAPREQARAELDGYFHAYLEEIGLKGGSRKYFSGIVLVPAARGLDTLRRKFSRPLLILMAIVGLLLVSGCANVANLLLARASARRNEIALRLAIGASRARLTRQLFTEGLLLVGIAALAGVLLARWGVTLLVSVFAGARGRVVLEPQFDGSVAAFTVAVAVITGLLFSLAPALHAARTDAAKPGGGGAGTARQRFSAGNLLVVVQIMLSVVLLWGATLFVRSLRNLTQLDAGFQRENVLTMVAQATLPKRPPLKDKAAEEDHARIGRMWQGLLEPLSALPQVRAASASSLSPMSGRDRGILMDVTGQPQRTEAERGIHINQVTAGYFDALGVGLIAGRTFGPGDQANSPKVAVLNQRAVQVAFGGSNPLGRRVTFPGQRVGAEYEVVGIVRDTRYATLRQAAEPMVYVPIEQAIDPLSTVMIAIRSKGDAAGLLTVVRRRMKEIVPDGFLQNVATVQQQVDDSLLEERLVSMLASLFGGLALMLAAIGLYGIISFTAIRRTREIGIRIAVGAQRGTVLWLVLRHTLGLAGAGLALGIPLVLLAKKYIESELYGVQGGDPTAIAGAALVLMGVAVTAGIWPAYRASRMDPMASLRQE